MSDGSGETWVPGEWAARLHQGDVGSKVKVLAG